jgi:hypothetical protein
MKILLFNPWIIDVKAFDFWLKPIGLLTLGRWLKESGHEVRLMDCLDRHHPIIRNSGRIVPEDRSNGTGKFISEPIQKPFSIQSIPRTLKRYGMPVSMGKKILNEWKDHDWIPDQIFVTSMMTYWYLGAWEAISVLKETFPSRPVVLGGVYPSLMPNHARNSGADLICPHTRPKEVWTFLNEHRFDLRSPISWMIPDYSFYNQPLSHLVYITSLGCPFRCTYCATPKLQSPMFEDPDRLTQCMIADLDRTGAQNIALFDDAILMNHTDHLDLLLENIIQSRIPDRGVRFHLPNGLHARLLTQRTASLMKQARFQTIRIGVETLNERYLLASGGKLNRQDFENAVHTLFQAGFSRKEISAYVMINLPGQTNEDVKTTIQKCKDLGIGVNVNEYSPIPGTPDYQSEIFVESTDPLLMNNALLPYWWDKGMSVQEIQKLKNELNRDRRDGFI